MCELFHLKLTKLPVVHTNIYTIDPDEPVTTKPAPRAAAVVHNQKTFLAPAAAAEPSIALLSTDVAPDGTQTTITD